MILCMMFAVVLGLSATFDGRPLVVDTARHSAFPMNQTWPGYERPMTQSKVDGFVRFDMDHIGELSVALPDECDAGDVKVRPYSCDGLYVTNGVVHLVVKRPGQFTIEFGERFPQLFVFADPPFEHRHDRDEIYFGPGVHEPGFIAPTNGQTVCIDAGAIVYGAIYLDCVTNVTITGRGILDSSKIKRVSPDGRYLRGLTNDDKTNLRDVTQFTCIASENIMVSGIVLRDSPFWTMIVRGGCRNVKVDNIKIVGQWRYNSDGIDICGCENVLVQNSFVRSFDDSFVVRDGGLAWGRVPVPSRNVVCKNCILWSDWGFNVKAQIGGSRDALIENVVIKNCVFANVDSGGVILAARPGGKNGIVRNIMVEDVEYDFAPVRYAHQWQKKENVSEIFVPKTIEGAKLFEICNYGYGNSNGVGIELLFDNISFRRIRAVGPYRRLKAIVNIVAEKECVRDLVVEEIPPRCDWSRKATFATRACKLGKAEK